MMPTAAPSTHAPGAAARAARALVPLVVMLFFAWGFATVLIDTLIPKLKGLFALTYAEAMLTQFAFFLAYLVVSLPAGRLLARIGYLRGIVVGLLIMAAGCLMFSPAALLGVYPGFLAALFVLASGITILQVAANPLIAVLGPTRTSHSRLTLAQAFNSLGTTVGPFVGAALILQEGVRTIDPEGLSARALAAARREEAHAVQLPFVGIAVFLVALATVFWLLRRSPVAASAAPGAHTRVSSLKLLARPRLALGAACIFLYVGAEVSVGSLMINYLMQESILAAPAARAGQLVALYWAGAMVGRVIGSVALRFSPAGLALAVCAITAALLASAAALAVGAAAAVAVIAIGLFNSIMFPTIFTLAIEGQGDDTPQASGIVCLAIVGGAVIPLLSGHVADRAGLSAALFVPGACYLLIAAYGLAAWRVIQPPELQGIDRTTVSE